MASTNIQTFPGKVGVSNTNPIHTLDIGSNVYIDDTADTKLRIVGNIHASGITVDGTITTIETENLSVKDPIILLASESTGTSDTGIIMKRADGDSNVAIFYDEAVGLKIGHTLSTAEDIHLTVDTSTKLSTSIYGPVTVADSSTQALTVDGGAYVTTDFKVGASKLFVDVSESSVGIGTDAPLATLDVHGTANVGALTVGSDLEVGTANLFVDTSTSNVGIGTDAPLATLDVHGTANVGALTVASDLEVGTGNLFVDTSTSNVGIGTTTPAYTLDVHGTANVGALTVASDLEVGTANLFVDTTTSNVGIGTTTPAYTLDVHGTANVGALTATSVSGDGSGLTALNGDQVTTGTVAAARIDNLDGSKITTGTVAAARIDNLDASKITTGTITRPVNTTGGVTASALTTNDYIYHGSDTDTSMGFPANDTITLNTAGSERMRITSGGNVGIGTDSPGEKLHVYTDSASSASQLFIRNANASNRTGLSLINSDNSYFNIQHVSGNSNVGIIENFSQTNGGIAFYAKGDGEYTFRTTDSNSLRMVIDNDGNVGIGTNSPSYKLEVASESATDILYLRNKTNASGAAIRFTDKDDESQYAHLTYRHSDGSSYGTGNVLKFTTSETSETLALGGALHIGVDGKDAGDAGVFRKNLFIQSTYGGNTSQGYGWWVGAQDQALSTSDNDLYFGCVKNGTQTVNGGILDQNTGGNAMNFTGQHRTFVKNIPIQQLQDKQGLIVSADQDDYIKMSGGVARGNEAITTNESLPIVSFSAKSNDKSCFGVVSTTEDPENRVEVYGNFKSTMPKELGDTRVYINSVGEGAVWVTNINGPLESGDYITTSNIAGYGMKQDDDILHNYTVAKITMNCDFNPQTIPKKIIKKALSDVDYWIDYAKSEISQEKYETLPENEREQEDDTYYKIYKQEVLKMKPKNDRFVHEVHQEMVNVLDEHGQLQWEDHPTETEKAYKIRYLTADGTETDEANAVHIAAFVGCTYHCG